MESQALVIGRSYACCEKRSPACPVLKVKLLDKVGRTGKLKIRFEDGPHPGSRSTSAAASSSCRGASGGRCCATSGEAGPAWKLTMNGGRANWARSGTA